MADYVKVASTDDLSPGDLLLVDLDGDRVVLANSEGQIYALAELCTHAECPLSEGELDGEELVCPCHGSRFNVKTGEVAQPARQRAAGGLQRPDRRLRRPYRAFWLGSPKATTE